MAVTQAHRLARHLWQELQRGPPRGHGHDDASEVGAGDRRRRFSITECLSYASHSPAEETTGSANNSPVLSKTPSRAFLTACDEEDFHGG
jgi:hypothetical protein